MSVQLPRLQSGRTEARGVRGSPVSFEDEDEHRLLALSNGRPDGDNMVCAYLALMFGLDGQCVKRWLGEPPAGARVRSYDAVDWAENVWIWIEGSADAPGQTDLRPPRYIVPEPSGNTEA
jgi:phenylpropionate dioxygenase-like ring-hydroxylating dioxygenase large terminal subunit